MYLTCSWRDVGSWCLAWDAAEVRAGEGEMPPSPGRFRGSGQASKLDLRLGLWVGVVEEKGISPASFGSATAFGPGAVAPGRPVFSVSSSAYQNAAPEVIRGAGMAEATLTWNSQEEGTDVKTLRPSVSVHQHRPWSMVTGNVDTLKVSHFFLFCLFLLQREGKNRRNFSSVISVSGLGCSESPKRVSAWLFGITLVPQVHESWFGTSADTQIQGGLQLLHKKVWCLCDLCVTSCLLQSSLAYL